MLIQMLKAERLAAFLNECRQLIESRRPWRLSGGGINSSAENVTCNDNSHETWANLQDSSGIKVPFFNIKSVRVVR